MASTLEKEALSIIAAAGVVEPALTKPAVQRYPLPLTQEMLAGLLARKWVSAEAVTYVPACPLCNEVSLILNGACPDCFHYDRTRITLAHHIPCAGVFEAPNGLEKIECCPKCQGRDMTDNDLEAVGEIYYCNDCAQRFPEPAMRLSCQSCKRNHPISDVCFDTLYAYRLTAEGSTLIQRNTDA